MDPSDRQAHWQSVYTSKGEHEVSWFQETPAISLELIGGLPPTGAASIIDIGGGASRLVDHLLGRGYQDLTVLDMSAAALDAARARLAGRGDCVAWIVADVTQWRPERRYDVWHDRAAFHFLTAEADQTAYLACLKNALAPGGHAVIGTFAPDGPERCSGLAVVRYDADGLQRALGAEFALIDSTRQLHATPWGSEQRFVFATFRRAN